jgi:hypothetical protein
MAGAVTAKARHTAAVNPQNRLNPFVSINILPFLCQLPGRDEPYPLFKNAVIIARVNHPNHPLLPHQVPQGTTLHHAPFLITPIFENRIAFYICFM